MLKKQLVIALLGWPMLAGAVQVEADTSYEHMDESSRAPWKSAEARVLFDGDGIFKKWGGAAQTTERFGKNATGAELFGVHQLSQGVAVETRISLSSGAEFAARRGVETSLYVGLPSALELTATLGNKQYAADSSTLLRVRLDRDFGPWRIGAGFTHDVQLNAQGGFGAVKFTTDGWSLAAHIAKGVEAERSETGAAIRMPVKAAALTGEFLVARDTRLRATITRTITTASRAGVNLGLIRTF